MNYFDLAVGLARMEGAQTLEAIALKTVAIKLVKNRSQEVCSCSAYSFPHRTGSGECAGYTGGDLFEGDADYDRRCAAADQYNDLVKVGDYE